MRVWLPPHFPSAFQTAIDKLIKEHKKTKHPIRKKSAALQIGELYASIKQGHRALKFLTEATKPVTRAEMVEVSQKSGLLCDKTSAL